MLKGHVIIEDSGRGYRRVVASPQPIRILQLKSIERVLRSGGIAIACGGGILL